jgi:hypothetical protein
MVMLLVAALCGLAVSAVGIAHQMLPRQFSLAQQRQIMTWEVARRWRALPAGKIFPASVPYILPAGLFGAAEGAGLTFDARRLGISPQESCVAGVPRAAAAVLRRYGCVAMMRATYVDSSGSLVATVGVAVLPDTAAAEATARALDAAVSKFSLAVRALAVAGTPAAGFADPQRQLAATTLTPRGPYVVMSTAGFADGRHRVPIGTDQYQAEEMRVLDNGVAGAAVVVLGEQPALPTCPGTPGC